MEFLQTLNSLVGQNVSIAHKLFNIYGKLECDMDDFENVYFAHSTSQDASVDFRMGDIKDIYMGIEVFVIQLI